ncbi:hypothetical protein OWV82_000890 [Melia azedarach]|uniref:Uncharacterized protein n=1 Tax=Melia azedarach TaxID=155640 RepID=A0ACC1YVL4_MELAZ|nr:hypothetical protein OWV82_000890 [Melia azedarach]
MLHTYIFQTKASFQASMASLLLLFEALMRCCQDHLLPVDEEGAPEQNTAGATSPNVGENGKAFPNEVQREYVCSYFWSENEDVQTWKIAESYCLGL